MESSSRKCREKFGVTTYPRSYRFVQTISPRVLKSLPALLDVDKVLVGFVLGDVKFPSTYCRFVVGVF